MKHFTGPLCPPGQILGRYAPTPSGYLHIGNAVNLVLTYVHIKNRNGKTLLRIDDMDAGRSRREYIDDIFASLEWLGLDYNFGPRDTEDFEKNWSQQSRISFYRSALDSLCNLTYGCDCSRSMIRQVSPDGTYPGTCRDKMLTFLENRCALRLKSPPDLALGDFIVWRKDNLPAYQLVSVLDDWDYGVNLIVRGKDLEESTQAQLVLADALGLDEFKNSQIIHHDLIFSESGEKLSKSKGANALKFHREQGETPLFIYKLVAKILGRAEEKVESLEDLL